MPKRAIPSLDQAVRAAIEWFREYNVGPEGEPRLPEQLVNFFFHGDGQGVQQLCSLIIREREEDDSWIPPHVHIDPARTDLADLLRSAAQFGQSYAGARRAFAEFKGNNLREDPAWSTFADALDHVLRLGGIYVFCCEWCRQDLRPDTDRTPHPSRLS